jgi:1,4-dihydroxy-2-naphthoate octaprenyltransferase
MAADCAKGLSLKAVMELAAPHTWGASVAPVAFAAAISLAMYGRFSAPLFYSLLLTSICLQCAVNTLNDYADFMKGVDTPENSTDPTDASIIYNRLDPKLALCTGLGFIGLAFLCGLYALLAAGVELALFGAAGALIVALYSFGKSPVSWLPIGEAVSGVAMGGVISLACVYAFTGALDLRVMALSVPVMLSIGLIMLTNNGSDIERDRASGRRTLPALIGRDRTLALHAAMAAAAVAAAAAASFAYFRPGLALLPLLAAITAFPEIRIIRGGLAPEARVASMRDVMRLHWRLSLAYSLMAASGLLSYRESEATGFMKQFAQWAGSLF